MMSLLHPNGASCACNNHILLMIPLTQLLLMFLMYAISRLQTDPEKFYSNPWS